MEGFDFTKESLLQYIKNEIEKSYSSSNAGHNVINVQNYINKYEIHIDESPDIYSIIKNFNKNLIVNPTFNMNLQTKDTIKLVKDVQKYDKQFIKSKIKDIILANFIIQGSIYHSELGYIFMIDTLKKLKEEHDSEYVSEIVPSPAPIPENQVEYLSVVEATPLTYTNLDEIKLLKCKVEKMEEQIKHLLEWQILLQEGD